MPVDMAQTIEAWFAANCDGEFVIGEDAGRYSVVAPRNKNAQIIFTTKAPLVAAAIERSSRRAELGMIARQGLPAESDMDWLRAVVGRGKLWFLGDMDPPDLMVFACLRHRMPEMQIAYLGVSDAYLSAPQVDLPKPFIMQYTASERRSLTTLAAVFPDFRQVIGPKCASLLDQENKIELEAAAIAAGPTAAILQPVFRRHEP
jgi:hypothetical protein